MRDPEQRPALQTFRRFVSIVGVEKAVQILEQMHGNVYIPKLETVLIYDRNKKIRQLREQGYSVKKLAREFDLTSVRIGQILKGGRG